MVTASTDEISSPRPFNCHIATIPAPLPCAVRFVSFSVDAQTEKSYSVSGLKSLTTYCTLPSPSFVLPEIRSAPPPLRPISGSTANIRLLPVHAHDGERALPSDSSKSPFSILLADSGAIPRERSSNQTDPFAWKSPRIILSRRVSGSVLNVFTYFFQPVGSVTATASIAVSSFPCASSCQTAANAIPRRPAFCGKDRRCASGAQSCRLCPVPHW